MTAYVVNQDHLGTWVIVAAIVLYCAYAPVTRGGSDV